MTRWRRHHTRAKFEDLIEALKKIKTLDSVVEIDKVLNPPNLMEEEEQEIYVPPSVAQDSLRFTKKSKGTTNSGKLIKIESPSPSIKLLKNKSLDIFIRGKTNVAKFDRIILIIS